MSIDSTFPLASKIIIPNQGLGTLAPMELTDIQKDWIRTIDKNDRSICLKPRQIFISTATKFYALMWASSHAGLTCNIFVDNLRKAQEFITDLSGWCDMLGIKKPVRNATKLVLENGAIIQAQSGRTKNAVRSGSTGLIILSEFAYYDYPELILASIAPALDSKGKIIIESTSTGASTYFMELWRKGSWTNKFYGLETHANHVEDPNYINEIEWEAYQDMGFRSRPHAAFFHKKLNTEFNMDHKRAFLEYPVLPEHAMITFGNRAIGLDPNVIDFDLIDYIPNLHIFKQPTINSKYIISYDPSAGTGNDYAAIAVLDRYDRTLCASWVCNDMDPDAQSKILHRIYSYYNTPPDSFSHYLSNHVDAVIVERNGLGNGLIPFIRKLDLPIQGITTNPGTSTYSKYMTISHTKRWIENGLINGDQHLLDEARALVREDETKFSGPDDLIIAIGIGLSYIERNPAIKQSQYLDPRLIYSFDRIMKVKSPNIP